MPWHGTWVYGRSTTGLGHEWCTTPPVTSDRRPRVLVADDDDDIRALIVWGLRADGYEVVEASSGMEAANRLAGSLLFHEGERAPDLIVTDVRMHGITGLTLLGGIRDCGSKIPVIIITAYDIAAVRAEAERLGADAVFAKPFDIDDLRTAVMNVMARRKSGVHAIDLGAIRRKNGSVPD
jgi:two-component system response regulator (stage 0 sporulation protein F)